MMYKKQLRALKKLRQRKCVFALFQCLPSLYFKHFSLIRTKYAGEAPKSINPSYTAAPPPLSKSEVYSALEKSEYMLFSSLLGSDRQSCHIFHWDILAKGAIWWVMLNCNLSCQKSSLWRNISSPDFVIFNQGGGGAGAGFGANDLFWQDFPIAMHFFFSSSANRRRHWLLNGALPKIWSWSSWSGYFVTFCTKWRVGEKAGRLISGLSGVVYLTRLLASRPRFPTFCTTSN